MPSVSIPCRQSGASGTRRQGHRGEEFQASAAGRARPRTIRHPEYDAILAEEAAALDAAWRVEDGRENPFLHLAMHLSITEQAGIDQPAGIRQAVQSLAARRGSLHAAHHEVMECLGEMIWRSQRSGAPPDGLAYLDCVRRRATGGRRGEGTR